MRQRELAQRRFEQARLELLYQERDLRLQELERERTSYGFPVDSFYGFGGAPVYPSYLSYPSYPVVRPGAHLVPNGHRFPAAAPPAPAAPARPSVVAPQHNRSSIKPIGD
jgi:hypothetical protein